MSKVIIRAIIISFISLAFTHSHEGHDHSMDARAEMKKQAKKNAHPAIIIPQNESTPTLEIEVKEDSKSGWNLHIKTTNFKFTPDKVNAKHVPGEGHAHLYINGKKKARIYSNWHHIGKLEKGLYEFAVTLNTNTHEEMIVNNNTIRATVTIKQEEQEDCH